MHVMLLSEIGRELAGLLLTKGCQKSAKESFFTNLNPIEKSTQDAQAFYKLASVLSQFPL